MTSSIFYMCSPIRRAFVSDLTPFFCGRGKCFLFEQTGRVHRGVGGVGLLCRRLVLLKQIPHISIKQQLCFGMALKADLVVTDVWGLEEASTLDYAWTLTRFFFIVSFVFFLSASPQWGSCLKWHAQTHLEKTWIIWCTLVPVFSLLSVCDWTE